MNAVHLAEQATLGALMLERELAADVTTWLRAEDFDHPWHRSVYASIRELHAAHAPVDPQRVGLALADRLGPRADLPHLLDLLQAAPTRPVGHRYAAMVLEASLRRDTACQGVLLQAAALSAGLSQHSRPVTAVVAQVDASLDHAEHRWRSRDRATPSRPAPMPRPWAWAFRCPRWARTGSCRRTPRWIPPRCAAVRRRWSRR